MDDEDVFGQPVKKGKGVKGKGKPDEAPEDDEERHADGRVKTKKEKEKEKKEREKQRKKEQVSQLNVFSVLGLLNSQAAKKKQAAPEKEAPVPQTMTTSPKDEPKADPKARTLTTKLPIWQRRRSMRRSPPFRGSKQS